MPDLFGVKMLAPGTNKNRELKDSPGLYRAGVGLLGEGLGETLAAGEALCETVGAGRGDFLQHAALISY